MPKFTGKKRTFMNNPPFLSKGENIKSGEEIPTQNMYDALSVGVEGSGVTKAQYNEAVSTIKKAGKNPIENYGAFVAALEKAGATNIPKSINTLRI